MPLFVAVIPKPDVTVPVGLTNPSISDTDLESTLTGSLFAGLLASRAHLKHTHVRFDHDSAGGLITNTHIFCHHSSRNGVHCAFAGEVTAWPGHPDLVAEAHDAFIRGDSVGDNDTEADLLLSFYETARSCGLEPMMDLILNALHTIKGSFAFILYDTMNHTLWAARDGEGAQEMWWGVSAEGDLVIGTSEEALDNLCEPSAVPFPAGCMFASHGQHVLEEPGDWGFTLPAMEVHPDSVLMSFLPGGTGGAGVENDDNNEEEEERNGGSGGFNRKWRNVKAVPRINENGVLCGSVYRVASEIQLKTMAH